MPEQMLTTVMEGMKRKGDYLSFLLDLLYFGDFEIVEQVASTWGRERVNLIGSKGKGGKPPLILAAHMPKPIPSPHAKWRELEGAPIALAKIDGVDSLVGPGVLSGQSDLLLKILAGSAFRGESLKRPLVILGLSGGEGRPSGVLSALDYVNRAYPTPGGHKEEGLAALYAPTSTTIWDAHPGLLVIEMELERELRHRRMPPHEGFYQLTIDTDIREGGLLPGHAQAFGESSPSSKSAIQGALTFLSLLEKQGRYRLLSFQGGEEAQRMPSRVTLQVATEAAHLENVDLPGYHVEIQSISDGASLPFPIDSLFSTWQKVHENALESILPMLHEGAQSEGLPLPKPYHLGLLATGRNHVAGSFCLWSAKEVDFEAIVNHYGAVVEASLPEKERPHLSLRVHQMREAFQAEQGEERTQYLQEVMGGSGESLRLEKGLVSTDACLFQRYGYRPLVYGPGGPLQALFQDNEHVPLADLKRASAFYEALIRKYCLLGEALP